MKTDYFPSLPDFPYASMNHFRDAMRALSSQNQQGMDGQHRNKVLCENASKRIKLETIPPHPHAVEENDDNEECVSLELEEDYDIPCHKNPFLFSPVLAVLFSHMDVETLKKARQVCHLWKDESLQNFKEKSEAVLNLEEICHASCEQRKVNAEVCLEFLKMMNGVEESEMPFENLCINLMDMRCKKRMSKILRTYGPQIASLNIMFCNPQNSDDDDDYNLDCFFKAQDFKLILLYWCTNLKILKLYNLPFSIAESSKNIFSVKELKNRKSYIPGGPLSTITDLVLVDDREYFPLGEKIVFHILKVSPQISRVEIDVEDEDAFDSFMDGIVMARNAGFLSNLNSLIFGTRFGCIFYENHLVSLIAMKLQKLRRLEILNMGQDMSVESLNKLFLQCKDSLEVFRLDVTPVTNITEFPKQFLCIPKMINLKHLEINCDKIQLTENNDLIRHFPNLKSCILDTGCSCEYCFTGRQWNSITLKCLRILDYPYSKSINSIAPIQFKYKTHCVRIFEQIRKWFPTVISLYADKAEDRFGLVDLFRGMSETNIEELYLEISCPKSGGIFCCLNKSQSVEEEETEFQKLLQRTQIQVFTKFEKECGPVPIFPELRKLSIVSNGCRNIDIDILRQLGILHLVENAPVLTKFTIKYCFKTCSKTEMIFDNNNQPLFEAEQ